MPVQSTPKEVDPGDVVLSPEKDICDDIYHRVLAEVCARIDQRIADLEAQTAAEPIDVGESDEDESVADKPVEDADSAALLGTSRRRPLLRAGINLMALAGLAAAVVALARDHAEAITSVTGRIEAAFQSIHRENVSRIVSNGGPEVPMSGSNFAQGAQGSAASPPSAAPAPDVASASSSDPSLAMAEATAERDVPGAPERDITPLIEKIARDVTALQTQLQDLKASQDQANRDHSKAIEQVQASQEQLARIVRASRTEPPIGAASARLIPRPPQAPPPRVQRDRNLPSP